MKSAINTNKVSPENSKLLYKLLGLAMILLFVTLTFLSVRVINNSEIIFKTFFYNLFNEPPIIGRMFYLYIKSLNIIDLTIIYNTLVAKLISLELFYYLLVVGLSQLIISILNYRLYVDNKRYLNYLITVSFLIVLIIWPIYPPYILPIAFNNTLSFISTIIKLIFTFELLIMLKLGYNYYQDNVFKPTEIFNEKYLSKLIKRVSIITISLLTIISLTFYFSSYAVSMFKDELVINYVINIESSADNLLSIELSEELQDLTMKYGVVIPSTIEGGAILNYFDLSEIDIGKMITNYFLDIVDNLSYIYINQPLSNFIQVIFMLAITLLFNRYGSLIVQSSIITNSLSFILTLYIFIFKLSKLALIFKLLGLILLLLTLFKLIDAVYNSHVIEKIKLNKFNNILKNN